MWLWPRRSLWRSVQYLSKRILRLKATPHAVAAGVASGIFASFFPLGVHFIVAAVVCYLVAGNLVAAALGTALGNPLTAPVLWGASYQTGKLVLNRHAVHGPPAHLSDMLHNLSFAELWKPILEPMTIGASLLGLLFGLVFYFVTRWGMTAFRARRRRRIEALQASRRDATRALGPVGHPAE